MEGTAVQDDILKIVSSDDRLPRYLYTYLTSSLGQSLLIDTAFGSVIQHIKVDHVRDIPILIPSNHLLTQISRIIELAQSNREKARDALIGACSQVYSINGLLELTTEGTSKSNCTGCHDSFWILSHDVMSGNNDGSEYRLDAHFYNPTAQQAVANIKNCRSVVKTVGEVAHGVLMGPRFKRNYVESTHGVPFLSGKNIVQIRPTDLKYLSNLQMADMQDLIIKKGWTLITCSGTIGRTCFVWENYENYAASQHILRVIPDESQIDPGYLYAFLSSRYGYEQILRYRHGSVIDEVTDKQIEHVLVPCPSRKDQEAIGDMVRAAYEKRAEAIRLEDEAQAILMSELTKAQASKGE